MTTQTLSIEIVFVGYASHLLRYKVVGIDGKCVTDGNGPALFKTREDAENFIQSQAA